MEGKIELNSLAITNESHKINIGAAPLEAIGDEWMRDPFLKIREAIIYDKSYEGFNKQRVQPSYYYSQGKSAVGGWPLQKS